MHQMLFRLAGILETINYMQFPEQAPFKDLLTRSKNVAAFRNFLCFKVKVLIFQSYFMM